MCGARRPGGGLGRKDRLLLLVEYEGNRRLRRFGTALFRWTGGRIGPRGRVVLLTTRGRRSGREHTVLLQSFPDDRGFLVVAANSGRPSHPDWYLNLVSGSPARVEVGGRGRPVRVEELSAAEAARAWPRLLAGAPSYDRFRGATSRVLPIVRLVPTGPGRTDDPRRSEPWSSPES